MSETLIPFHEHAEEIGTFLHDDRARDAERQRRERKIDGPSENID